MEKGGVVGENVSYLKGSVFQQDVSLVTQGKKSNIKIIFS